MSGETAIQARLTDLLQANQAIASSLDLEDVLHAIAREAASIAGTHVVRLFLLDDDGQGLRCRVAVGLPLEAEQDLMVPVGESFSGQVAATGEPLAVADCRGDPRLRHSQHAAQYGLVSYLGLPVKLGDRVVGVLVFNTAAPRTYTSDDIAFLSAFAQQSALAIQNARLYHQEQERRRQMEAVRAIGEEITRELDLNTLLRLIQERATALIEAVAGAVFLWDEGDQVLIPRAWSGLGDWVAQVRLGPGEGLAGTVAQRREGMIDNEYRVSPYASPILLERTRVATALAEPLLYQDRLVGVITLYHEEPDRHFTEADKGLVRLFAAQAAIAIENARLHEAAQRELAGRKKGEETLRALYQASLQIQEPLELRERLNRLLNTARKILHLDRLNVLLADPEGEWLQSVASLGTGDALDAIRVPIGPEGGGIARAHLTQQTITWDGHAPVPEDLRLRPPYDQIEAFRSRVFAIVPLVVQGRAIGVLGVDRKHSRGPLDAHTVELLHLFAAQAAIAIENARLFAKVEQAARETRSLYEVAQSLTTSLDFREVLHIISAKTTELLGTPHAQVVIWDENTRTLRFGAAYGTEAEDVEDQQFRLGQGVNGIVAQTRERLIVNDYPNFPYRIQGMTDLTAVIGVPLLYRGRLLGVLTSHAKQRGKEFTQGHSDLLTSFADQAAVAIENARLYDAVQRQAAELEDRVRQRTAELEEALRVKAQFLANMSHELRTPLNFVIGFSELLREGTGGPLTPKQAGYLDRIHTGGKRLLELVTHLLEMAETDSQPTSFQLDRLVVGEVLDEVLAPLAATSQAKSVGLERALHPGLPVVVADRRKFSQILYHLVTNAIRFTPTGGRVTVSARRVSTSKGEEAELAVQDTGIGIRPQDLERIFRPFEQADGSDTRRYGGAGLGLALARHLTELHGGRVWAESEGEGCGARFIVRLPLLPAPPPPRILVVEDQAPVREALCAALTAASYGVEGACTGIEALERLAAGPPDLLVLDMGLPDMDGRDLLKQLRAEARTRDLPILVVSGLDFIQPDQILTLGADEFLTKPVSPQVLSATVARLLRRPARGGTSMSATAQDSTGRRS